MRESLSELFVAQQKLDARIIEEHHAPYEKTMKERVLAFLVELGEMANETRCFKYWSYKGPSPKEVILEEWADGLHFLLSLGVALGVESYEHEMRLESCSLVEQILKCYHLAGELVSEIKPQAYAMLFSAYLNLLPLLGADFAEGKKAYYAKLEINYARQDGGY